MGNVCLLYQGTDIELTLHISVISTADPYVIISNSSTDPKSRLDDGSAKLCNYS